MKNVKYDVQCKNKFKLHMDFELTIAQKEHIRKMEGVEHLTTVFDRYTIEVRTGEMFNSSSIAMDIALYLEASNISF